MITETETPTAPTTMEDAPRPEAVDYPPSEDHHQTPERGRIKVNADGSVDNLPFTPPSGAEIEDLISDIRRLLDDDPECIGALQFYAKGLRECERPLPQFRMVDTPILIVNHIQDGHRVGVYAFTDERESRSFAFVEMTTPTDDPDGPGVSEVVPISPLKEAPLDVVAAAVKAYGPLLKDSPDLLPPRPTIVIDAWNETGERVGVFASPGDPGGEIVFIESSLPIDGPSSSYTRIMHPIEECPPANFGMALRLEPRLTALAHAFASHQPDEQDGSAPIEDIGVTLDDPPSAQEHEDKPPFTLADIDPATLKIVEDIFRVKQDTDGGSDDPQLDQADDKAVTITVPLDFYSTIYDEISMICTMLNDYQGVDLAYSLGHAQEEEWRIPRGIPQTPAQRDSIGVYVHEQTGQTIEQIQHDDKSHIHTCGASADSLQHACTTIILMAHDRLDRCLLALKVTLEEQVKAARFRSIS